MKRGAPGKAGRCGILPQCRLRWWRNEATNLGWAGPRKRSEGVRVPCEARRRSRSTRLAVGTRTGRESAGHPFLVNATRRGELTQRHGGAELLFGLGHHRSVTLRFHSPCAGDGQTDRVPQRCPTALDSVLLWRSLGGPVTGMNANSQQADQRIADLPASPHGSGVHRLHQRTPSCRCFR